QMPGHSIDGFLRKSVVIANAGIYDLRLHHDDVLIPVLRKWGVFDRTDLSGAGEKAREELGEFLEQLDAAATKFETRRAERRGRQARGPPRGAPRPPGRQEGLTETGRWSRARTGPARAPRRAARCPEDQTERCSVQFVRNVTGVLRVQTDMGTGTRRRLGGYR